MPLMSCESEGESGWKFGESGTCYTGTDAKERAIAQGIAMGEIGAEKLDEAVAAAKFQGTSDAPGAKVTVMLRVPESLAAGWSAFADGLPPHFTLLFVGDVPEDKRAQFLGAVAGEVFATSAFGVELT
ncbi:MAG: hypothetical protein ABIL09_23990, partial [Gemmatimonadota bacterium]